METTRNLPDDILEDILVRLPVKCLLRWKCVCKRWYALFGDYAFTIKHYRFQSALHIAQHGTLPLFLAKPPKPTEFFVLSKHGGDDVVLNVTRDFHRDIPPTFPNEYELKLTFRCLGIVNGVICLQWGNTCLALWNPATREFKEVPCWPIMPDNKVAEKFGGNVLGFGFDPQSQDFKILGLIDYDVPTTVYEYHLYSLKANSWKKVDEAPRTTFVIHSSLTDAYLNYGVYYWRAVDRATVDNWNATSVIIAFNFNTELFTELELPKHPVCNNREHNRRFDGACRDCSFSLILGKYKETLALFINHTIENKDCHVEIWVVTRFREDDHGIPLSWHLAVRISLTPFFIRLYVHKLRECGDLLLHIQYGDLSEEEGGCLYDPTTRTFNNLGLECSSCFTYVESLFSVTRMLN